MNTSHMASSSLLPRIILGTAILFTVVAGGKNFLNKGALDEARKEAETQKVAATTALDQARKVAEVAKTSSEKLKAAAEAQSAAEAKSSAARAEIEKAKKDAEEALAQVKTKETEIAELKTKLPAPNAAPTPVVPAEDPAMVKALEEAKALAAEKETLLKTVQVKAEEADKKAAALEAENLRRVAGLNKPGLEGKVLAVNPNWSFVVLNIGDRQGVVAGSSLIVKRAGNLVARLRVTSVEPSTSIADIQGTTLKGATVQPGDVVIFPGS